MQRSCSAIPALIHTHICIYIYTHICMHVYVYMCNPSVVELVVQPLWVAIQALVYMYISSLWITSSCWRVVQLSCVATQGLICIHTYIYTHLDMCVCLDGCWVSRTASSHAHTCTHTCVLTNTCIYVHTYTHVCTLIHTHAVSCWAICVAMLCCDSCACMCIHTSNELLNAYCTAVMCCKSSAYMHTHIFTSLMRASWTDSMCWNPAHLYIYVCASLYMRVVRCWASCTAIMVCGSSAHSQLAVESESYSY